MYETNTISLPNKAKRIFVWLLSFYPTQYKKRFGQEMLFVFEDLCKEELEKHQKLTIHFWFHELSDVAISILREHVYEIQQKGMKKYLQQTFHINTYNIISIVLLLPILLMTGIEIVSRIAQRDLTHYNRPLYAFFSHTFLYWTPVLFTWVILFPFLAALLSTIPLIKLLAKKKVSLFSWSFIGKNIVSIALLLFGLGFVALIRLHDFIPCLFYGLTHFGLGQINHIIFVCKNT